jgi:hypothetical protein
MSSHPTLVFNLVTEAVKENYGKKRAFIKYGVKN